MRSRILLATGAALIALLTAGGAKAQPYNPIRCDTCATSDDFRARAVAAGEGHHLVFNLPANTIEYWEVKGGTGREDQAGLPSANLREHEPTTLDTSPGGLLQSLVHVPVSRLPVDSHLMRKTAYDFVTDFNMKGMIESAAGNAVFVDGLIAPIELAALVYQQRSRAVSSGREGRTGVVLRIALADASSVDVAVGLDSRVGKYLPGSARTAGGQLIPDRLQQVRGTWTSEGGDELGALADHFATLGATIIPADAPSGTPGSIACTPSAASHVCELENVAR